METLWPMLIEGVALRTAEPGDVEGLLAFRNDPAANRFMLNTSVDPVTFEQNWLGPASEGTFSCVAAVDGTVIGMGFLHVLDGMGQPGMPRNTEARVGYFVHPAHTRRGYATSIGRGLLTASFETLGVRRVYAGCYADNLGSVRVLEKIGMRREQHGIEDSWHAELGWIDGYTYALLATEWRLARGQ